MYPKPDNSDKRRQTIFLLVVVFAAMAALTYFPIFQGKVPFPSNVVTDFPPWWHIQRTVEGVPLRAEYGDIVTLFYTWRHFHATATDNWELPLWNPYILSGTPFLGETQSALFYPFNWIFFLLPVHVAWTIKILISLVLVATLTALFVRSIGGNFAGAVCAGIVFSLAGNMTTWQSTTLTDAALWLPLIFLAVRRLCLTGPDTTAFVLTVVAFALPVLAGHPETAAHMTVAGCAYALWQSFGSGRSPGDSTKRLLLFGGAGLVAIGVSAIQILPTLEWLGQINHTIDMDWGTNNLFQQLSFFSRDIRTNPNSSGLLVPESAAYAGAFTLLLMPLAFLHRNKRETFFFLVAIILSFQIVIGWGPGHWFASNAPLLSGIKNWRFVIVIDFGLAVLAGLAVSALADYPLREKFERRYIWIASGVGFVLVSLGIVALQNARTVPAHWLQTPLSTAVFLVGGYCLVVARTSGWLRSSAFAIASVGLIAVDMMTFAHEYFPFSPPNEIYPESPVMEFLKKDDPYQARVANFATYGPNFEMMYGVSAISGYDLGLRLIKEFLREYSEPTLDDVVLNKEMFKAANDRRLDLLNTKYIIVTSTNGGDNPFLDQPDRFSLVYSTEWVEIFENKRALPRAFFVPASLSAFEVLPHDHQQLERVKDPQFDPERSVILAELPEELLGADVFETGGEGPARIEWTRTSPNRSEMNVEVPQPGILVLSQIFYPGWRVLVDDIEVPIRRVNYALTGVALREGNHSVKFVYRPASYRFGSAITVFSILALAVGVIVRRRGVSFH